MRFVYLDEAGISNLAHEPHVVVAGPIVHADRQWKSLERYLTKLADDAVPSDCRDGFVFHATELYSGGKNFPREVWPKEERWKILDELVSVGSSDKFDLPFVYGSVDRAKYAAKRPDLSVREVTINCQAISFLICVNAVQYYMQKLAPDEVATIVMENNDEARSLIKELYLFVRNPAHAEMLHDNGLGDLVPENVVDDVHFAEKQRSSLLQIADCAAFCIKRHLMGARDSDRFYEPFKSRLVLLPKNELQPFG